MNGGGVMHGGVLMTFADCSMFIIAREALGGPGVTVSMNAEFVGAVAEGRMVECRGEVVRGGRSLIFVRAIVTADGEPAMSVSTVLRKVRPRT